MITFAYNPTSWDANTDALIPGGMADALIQPILPHLTSPYQITDAPVDDTVNVYLSHRSRYGGVRPAGEHSVFMSHGLADKRWREGQRLKFNFASVFVSGPAWSDKTKRTRFPGQIYEVGYPKIDPLINGEVAAPPRDSRIRVVWAPTHGGGGEKHRNSTVSPQSKGSKCSTWWHRDDILALLPESEFDVVEAPHPRHRSDRKSTLAEYVGADVVIADGGSTIYEAWALDLPVVFPDWLVAAGNISRFRLAGGSFEAELYRHRIGRHVADPDLFAGAVVDAAANGITEAEQNFIEPILPRAYRGVSGRMHAEALDEIHAAHVPRAA